MDEFEIDPPEDRDPPRRPNAHPWWSRLLYALYALAAFAGAAAAYARGMTELAVGAGVIGLVLLWKAGQRVR